MAAALVTVAGTPSENLWEGRELDLRVDYHEDPVSELERLYDVATAYEGFSRALEAMFAGDPQRTLAELEPSRRLLPRDGNIRSLHAGALAATGNSDDAVAELRALLAEHPGWATVIAGFVQKGMLALPEGVDLESLLG